MTAAPPEIHTLDEAAAILRVKPSWLERQAAARKIPFTMLGGAYHFTSEHLATIVRLHERTPTGRETASRKAVPKRTPAPSKLGPLDINPLRPRLRSGPRSAA